MTDEQKKRVEEIRHQYESGHIEPDQVADLLFFIDSQTKRIGWLEAGKIHTCHSECQREECVQAREIARLEAELKRALDALNETQSEFSKTQTGDETMKGQSDQERAEEYAKYDSIAWTTGYDGEPEFCGKKGEINKDKRDGFLAGLQAERVRAQELMSALENWLKYEACGETSCPIPMRAMCSNPMHKDTREAPNKHRGGS